MNRDFTNFSYKIDRKAKKVLLTTYLEDEILEIKELKLITREDFLLKIKQDKKLDFQEVFIYNFELPDTDDTENFLLALSEVKIIDSFIVNEKPFEIKSLSLNKINFSKSIIFAPKIDFSGSSFLEADFSYSYLNAEEVNFSGCRFIRKGVNFKAIKFGQGNKYFENCSFEGGDVNFSIADFSDGNVIFDDSFFGKGRVNFMTSIFGTGRVSFVRVRFSEGEKLFERCEFGDGNVSFRSAQFGDGSVNFRRTIFGNGEKNFSLATFGTANIRFTSSEFGDGKLNFRMTEFGRGIKDFHYSRFGNADLIFDKTFFYKGDVDFRACDFGKGRIIFNRIDIAEGDLNFEGIEKQEGNIQFKNANFGKGNIIFSAANCPESDFIIENSDLGSTGVFLSKSIFKNIQIIGTQINNYFDLRVSKAKKIAIINSVVHDVIDMVFKNETDFEELDFSGIRLIGRIFIDWENPDVKKLIYKQDNPLTVKAEQFRMLKENFRNNGQYNEEDYAYVEFKRLEAKIKLQRKIHKHPKLKLWYKFVYWMNNLIMDKLGVYATNPGRVLLGMLTTYVFFSLLYLVIEMIDPAHSINSSLFDNSDPRVLGMFAKAFYHSAITFLTIGYGDYYPEGIIRWLSAVEGFIGLFMMSYFTVAFVRKILR